MNRARAYSLIEVLIATTVLGLGLLGLIAILAGGAVQQQTASFQNLSVGFARNNESLLDDRLGRPGGNFSLVREGQWTYVPMDEDTLYLTMFPGYLLVDAPENTVFGPRFEDSQPSPSAPDPANNYTQGQGGIFDTEPVRSLRHRRIEMEDAPFSVTVELRRWDSTSGIVTNDTETIVFEAPMNVSTDEVLLTAVVGPGSPVTSAQMRFNRRESFSTVGTARIESYNIGFPVAANWFVNRITVNPYSWRNDQLISLQDRLITEPDQEFPGDQRPIMTYAALIRRSGSNTQLCFFTYACRALSRPEEPNSALYRGLAFVPPDGAIDVEAGRGVLREIELDIGYDQKTQTYFLEIDAGEQNDKGWVMSQGQILMMSSELGVIGQPEDPSDPGADFPVRVVSTRTVGGNIQAFLDRAPRVGGRSPIEDLFDPAVRVSINVWGVQPLVRSKTDNTDWALTPIEARVIQVTDQ